MSLMDASAPYAETLSLHCGSTVRTSDGVACEVIALVCDVCTMQISHLVVGAPGLALRIVQVSCFTPGGVHCLMIELERQELEQLATFVAPYGRPASRDTTARVRLGSWLVPRGDAALTGSACVADAPLALSSPVPVRGASLQYVGHIVLWNLECGSGRISSIVVREGQRFNYTDVVVPGSRIDQVDDDGVQLRSSSSRHTRERSLSPLGASYYLAAVE